MEGRKLATTTPEAQESTNHFTGFIVFVVGAGYGTFRCSTCARAVKRCLTIAERALRLLLYCLFRNAMKDCERPVPPFFPFPLAQSRAALHTHILNVPLPPVYSGERVSSTGVHTCYFYLNMGKQTVGKKKPFILSGKSLTVWPFLCRNQSHLLSSF